tara:strand:+ start:153 stop:746 length:594 start_codon:yes stop_codon:yes gene_type:complete
MQTQFILASSSKSRVKILKNSGFKFETQKPLCDEEEVKKQINFLIKKPLYFAKRLSFEKAKSVSILNTNTNKYVIGCDTLISFQKKIFDKAKNMREAKQKIKNFSGKKHKIISAVTICKNGKKIWQTHEISEVKIKKLSNDQINKYLSNSGNQILGSVGCYQVELLGTQIIEKIDGDFFNVMGLPLFKLMKYVSKIK